MYSGTRDGHCEFALEVNGKVIKQIELSLVLSGKPIIQDVTLKMGNSLIESKWFILFLSEYLEGIIPAIIRGYSKRLTGIQNSI